MRREQPRQTNRETCILIVRSFLMAFVCPEHFWASSFTETWLEEQRKSEKTGTRRENWRKDICRRILAAIVVVRLQGWLQGWVLLSQLMLTLFLVVGTGRFEYTSKRGPIFVTENNEGRSWRDLQRTSSKQIKDDDESRVAIALCFMREKQFYKLCNLKKVHFQVGGQHGTVPLVNKELHLLFESTSWII